METKKVDYKVDLKDPHKHTKTNFWLNAIFWVITLMVLFGLDKLTHY